jgi:hypothetical protein
VRFDRLPHSGALSHCQQVKRKENKKGPQITRIFVPKFLLICENPRNLRAFLVSVFGFRQKVLFISVALAQSFLLSPVK